MRLGQGALDQITTTAPRPPSKKRLKRLMWHSETQHQQGPRSHGTMGERGEHLVQGIQVGIFAKC